MDAGLKTGELASRAGVSIETLRFYERRGLVPPPPRDPRSNYRRYPDSFAARVRFIKRAQGLGFTLDEIRDLLELDGSLAADCESVCAKSQAKIEEIERKQRELERIRIALERLVEGCQSRRQDGGNGCHILEHLEDEL